MLIYSISTNATIYYFSSSGSDSNNGTSTGTPKQTITALNALTLVAGDQVLLNKGNTFYGTIDAKSGTSGNPIIYGAYGTGNNPIVTGFTNVTSWTNLGSNIWESTNPVSTLSTCEIVTINGVPTAKGRTPNAGSFYTVSSHSSYTSVTSPSLNSSVINWTGAKVCNRLELWTWRVGQISAHTSQTITYSDGLLIETTNGNGFFIQDDARTLDVQNEWYYNPSTKKIRVYSIFQPINVNLSTLDKLLTVSYLKHDITIQNITFKGSNDMAINLNVSINVIIQNCTIDKTGGDGVYSYDCVNSIITNNNIKNNYYCAIESSSPTSGQVETITYNTIDSTSMVIGSSKLYSPGGIFTNVSNSLIQYNSIDHSGYDGVHWYSKSGQCRNNFINNSLQNRSDGGGIYTSGIFGAMTNMVIDGNIIINTKGYGIATNGNYDGVSGIYLDSRTQYVTVSNNFVSNTVCPSSNNGRGIYTSGSDHITIYGNKTINNDFGLKIGNMYVAAGSCNNMNVHDNIFVAKTSTQRAAAFESNYNEIPTFFSNLTNNIYARPMDDNLSIFYHQPNTDWLNKSLSQWIAFSGETNATKSSKAVTSESDIMEAYNNTTIAKMINTPNPGITINGVTRYASSFLAQPYTGYIILKDILNNPSNINLGKDNSGYPLKDNSDIPLYVIP
jgi:hypothetical protein